MFTPKNTINQKGQTSQCKEISHNMSGKNRFLIVAEKPYHAERIADVFRNMAVSDQHLNFDVDVIGAFCHVEDINNSCFPPDELKLFTPFKLRSMNVAEEMRIHVNNNLREETARKVSELFSANAYTAVVNACVDDTRGKLKFMYVIEAFGLENYHTEDMHLLGMTSGEITSELLALGRRATTPSTH